MSYHEVGVERFDGKFNVWRKEDGYADWELTRVFDEEEEAQAYVLKKNQTNKAKWKKEG